MSKRNVFRRKSSNQPCLTLDELKMLIENGKYPKNFFGMNIESEYTCSSSTTTCSSSGFFGGDDSLSSSELSSSECSSGSLDGGRGGECKYKTEIDDMFTPSPDSKIAHRIQASGARHRRVDRRGSGANTPVGMSAERPVPYRERPRSVMSNARYPVRNVNRPSISKGLKKVGNMMQASARKLLKLLDKRKGSKTPNSGRGNRTVRKAFQKRLKKREKKTKVIHIPNV